MQCIKKRDERTDRWTNNPEAICPSNFFEVGGHKKGKRKVQGVPQSQTAALPRHQEEEETDKTKQAQIEQMDKKHEDKLSLP